MLICDFIKIIKYGSEKLLVKNKKKHHVR